MYLYAHGCNTRMDLSKVCAFSFHVTKDSSLIALACRCISIEQICSNCGFVSAEYEVMSLMFVISGTVRWNYIPNHALQGYNLQTSNSFLTAVEVQHICGNMDACLSVDYSASQPGYSLNRVTRLEAGNDWGVDTRYSYYDIFYASRGTYEWSRHWKIISIVFVYIELKMEI